MTKLVCLVVLLISGIQSQDRAHQTPEQLCENRNPEEFFRLSTDGDCRDVVRCDKVGTSGAFRLGSVRCPDGLAFDVDRQICDMKRKIFSCDKLDRKM